MRRREIYMHASLVSREVICDSVETVVYAERMPKEFAIDSPQ